MNDTTDTSDTTDLLYDLIVALQENEQNFRQQSEASDDQRGSDYWRGAADGMAVATTLAHNTAGRKAAARLEASQTGEN